jgi:hypothetical protein
MEMAKQFVFFDAIVDMRLVTASPPNGQTLGQSCGKGDFARETLSVPVEPYVATLVASYHGLYRLSGKALVRRRVDGRTSRLDPAEHDHSTPT